MLSDKMQAQLNEQITKELYSSYLYLQMAAWFDDKTLPGFASWMKVQAQEEIAHAMILYNYVIERGGKVDLGAMEKPPQDYASPLQVFEKTLAHEQGVTISINALMKLAISEDDYASKNRLEWFIGEQVEEESNPTEVINQLKIVGDRGEGILLLDQQLGARIYTPPPPLAAK